MILQTIQRPRPHIRKVSHYNGHKVPLLSSGAHIQRLRPRLSTSSEGRDPVSSAEGSPDKTPSTPVPVPDSKPLSTATRDTTPSVPASAVDVKPSDSPGPSPAASAAAIPASTASGSVAEEKETSKPTSSNIRSFPVELSDDDMFGTKGLMQELTDQQKFGKRGEAWFFAQLLVCLLILFPPMELKGLLDLVGTLAISAGLVFLAYALFCLGRSLSPLPAPRQENKLVTSGMYGYVRHPMYGGLILVAIGMTLVTGSESRLALSLLLWWILEQKANVEEMLLEQLHPEYKAYKERVKKFIPYIY